MARRVVRNLLSSVLFSAVLFFSNPYLLKADEIKYAPGELIVKLKEGKTISDVAQLNAKYGVTALSTVFARSEDPDKALDKLKNKLTELNNTHPGWYWQLDKDSKEYKDYAAKLAKEKEYLREQIQCQEELIARLGQRQKRAEEGVQSPDLSNIYTLKASNGTDISQMQKDYAANPDVEYAQANKAIKLKAFPETLPNDTYVDADQNNSWSKGAWGQKYKDMWGLKKIKADEAWLFSQGKSVVVAVVDTGVDYDHDDIKGNIYREADGSIIGYDFVNNDADPKDDYGHGTHVAGIIAAMGNNHMGVIGVSPKAKIMAVKGLDKDGYGYSDGLANCLRYAADHGADVINNSWSGEGSDSLIEEAIQYALSKGCIVTAAAGNSNINVEYEYPANIEGVIAVSSIDENGKVSGFTNVGSRICVAAPGEDILSLKANGIDMDNDKKYFVGESYFRASGTSMACPHVSGLAALVLSNGLELSTKKIKNIIYNSACSGKEWSAQKGYGVINAKEALTLMDTSNPAQAKLYYPYVFVQSRKFELKGSAASGGFKSYKIEYKLKDSEDGWTDEGVVLKNGGKKQITDDNLATVKIPKTRFSGGSTLKEFTFRLTLDNGYVSSLNIKVDKRMKSGWPKIVREYNSYKGNFNLETEFLYSQKEKQILVTGDKLYLFSAQGDKLKEWEYYDPYSYSAISMGDFDPGEAGMEVVAGNISPGTDSSLNFLYPNDTAKDWSQQISQPQNLLIADLNKDGDLKVVASALDSIEIIDKEQKVWQSLDINPFTATQAACADLDKDRKNEIVSSQESYVWGEGAKYRLGIYSSSLEELVMLSYSRQRSLGDIRLADLDGDGKIEVIVSGYDYPEKEYFFSVYKYSNHSLELCFSVQDAFCNFIADLDRDGKPELIGGNEKYSCIWRNDGSLWRRFGAQFVPILAADLEGDSKLELYGWEGMVYNIDTGKISKPGLEANDSIIGDFDSDGLNEVLSVSPTGAAVYLRETDGVYSESGTWLQDTHDSLNSCLFVGTKKSELLPSMPVGLTVFLNSKSEIKLKWKDNSNNETGFIVEGSPNEKGGFSQIARIKSNAKAGTGSYVQYKDISLDSSKAYYYRVRAYNSNGSSVCSESVFYSG